MLNAAPFVLRHAMEAPVSRLPAALITALLTLLLGVGGHAVAGAAPPTSSPRPATVHADVSDSEEAADDSADGEDSGEDDAADPADAVDDGLDFCDITLSSVASDEPGSGAPGDLADPDDPGDNEDTPEDDQPADCTDDGTAEQASPKAAAHGDKTVLLKTLLSSGTVDGGTVTMSGPGTVTQELLMPGRSASLRAVASGTTKLKAKPPAKVLIGSVTKSVRKAGKVRLTVHLNRAGRIALRNAKKDVTITVKTVTHVKGKKAQTTTRTLHVTLKGAKRA